ncbi:MULTISPECIES: tautomerase family protein [Streptomyces]|uniref:4-oxalocrotonate tautomerase family protein n=2 Tax=Streptomyces TaxID=1883 RepID=A0AAT9HFL4_9ACTN|nr:MULTISPECIES: 4-oxalocrotonate tautomerase family protein [unclassified Streptomyces]MDT0397297.1 4-oxalocrotonate tautomerase family protein [Streptomyces sp. DSM 41636]MDT0401608.1 4-oxalocrotonate tautomerase family protein [Streptomyces sp. DSM 41635]
MPLIDVKLYEGRLDGATETELIARITDAVAEVFGDQARAATWIVLQEVPATRWGIAGVPGKPPLSARG